MIIRKELYQFLIGSDSYSQSKFVHWKFMVYSYIHMIFEIYSLCIFCIFSYAIIFSISSQNTFQENRFFSLFACNCP